jgi:hypothetical protein
MKNPHDPEIIVPTQPQKRGQGYGLIRTYRSQVGGPRPQILTVRVDINRNAYDHQSHYRAELLTTANGWQELHRILPESTAAIALPTYVRWDNTGSRQDCITAIEALAERLVSEAFQILGLATG